MKTADLREEGITLVDILEHPNHQHEMYVCADKCGERVKNISINFRDLSDEDKFIMCVYSRSICDFVTTKSYIQEYLGWTKYKIQKIAKKLIALHIIEVVPAFSEYDGLIYGKGYDFNLRRL